MQQSVDGQEFERVFAAQRTKRLALKRSSAEQRKVRLRRLREEILRRAGDVDAALHADLRKPRMGADHFEVAGAVGEIDLALAELDRWMEPPEIEPSAHLAGNEVLIRYEPRGIVLLFGPWNFPFALTFSPLASIIAAGNACIVKPNELQPETSRFIAEIVRAVFPEDEVAVFEGGIPVAEALQELPFDHVFFTGSPAIGKRVMAAAARHLTSVTLELGGKCPLILDDTSDLDEAAAKITMARFFNAGQLCLSVDYVWVPSHRRDALVERLEAVIEQVFYVDGVLQTDRIARIVDRRNLDRIRSLIDRAVVDGGRIVVGGEIEEDTLTVHPTVMVGMDWQTPLMQEEIFGPVLPVLAYDDIAQVADHIDRTGKPLAIYVISRDRAFVEEVLMRTSSGGVTVNDVMLHYQEPRLPFGGVNKSGVGRCRGLHGFRELSNLKSIFIRRT